MGPEGRAGSSLEPARRGQCSQLSQQLSPWSSYNRRAYSMSVVLQSSTLKPPNRRKWRALKVATEAPRSTAMDPTTMSMSSMG